MTIDEMIDDQEKRLTALRNCMPNVVLLALYGIAVVACVFTGYASGLERDTQRSRAPVYVTGVLFATIILLIQDLDRPNLGFVTVSQQPMINVAASLDRYPQDYNRVTG